MTTTASLPSVVGRRGTAIIESPTATGQLDLLAESIRLAAAPAFFAVWQDGPDSMRLFVDVLVHAGLTTPHVIRADNLATKLKGLEKRASSLSKDDGIVFLGCLSALPDQERKQFNAARDRLLAIPTKMIFVESVADEGKVRLGFPDVLSQVSYDCRLFLRDEENPFATSEAPRQVSVAKAPAGALSGSIDEVRAADAVCLLEVGAGVRVKFAVPLSCLGHLEPKPGLEVLWSPGKEGEPPTFWTHEPEPPDPQLLNEFEELTRRFHQALKHRKPRLAKDGPPHHE